MLHVAINAGFDQKYSKNCNILK